VLRSAISNQQSAISNQTHSQQTIQTHPPESSYVTSANWIIGKVFGQLGQGIWGEKEYRACQVQQEVVTQNNGIGSRKSFTQEKEIKPKLVDQPSIVRVGRPSQAVEYASGSHPADLIVFGLRLFPSIRRAQSGIMG
jgi:hypothetical protein